MGCKYAGEDFAVFHGIFRGLRVRDSRTGDVIIPGYDLKAQTLRAWSALPKIKFTSRRAALLAEQYLFRDCGLMALGRMHSIESPLGYAPTNMVVEHYWRQAEMQALREQD